MSQIARHRLGNVVTLRPPPGAEGVNRISINCDARGGGGACELLPIDALRIPWADSTYTVKLAKPGIGNLDMGGKQ